MSETFVLNPYEILVLSGGGPGGGSGGGGGPSTASGLPFVPAGSVSATDVQSAIVEVAADAANALSAGLAPKFDKTGTLSTLPTGPLVRRDLNYALATSNPNLAEVAVNGVVRSWSNEWGALRGRIPYSNYNDALARAIIEPGDTVQAAGNAFEIVDRRLPAGDSRQSWGRRWSDGRLVRGGNLMIDVYYHTNPSAPLPAGLPVPCLVIMQEA